MNGPQAATVRTAAALVFVLILLTVGFVGTAAAQSAPDCTTVSHDITADGDYAVTNLGQLQCMGNSTNTSSSDSFVLTQDIDASGTSSWNGGAGFKHIDDFEGSLDGQGYEITGLKINRPSERRVGLFGQTSGTIDIQNLGLVDVNITGYFTSGTLLGLGEVNITDSYVTGNITANGAGGFVGRFNGGTIERSYSNVDVQASPGSGGGASDAGGLVGTMNSGTIKESYALGDSTVSDPGNGFVDAGGLVASASGGEIRNSYARGNATATGLESADAGGFIGYGGGFGVSITNAYSTGIATADTNEGGFAGDFDDGLTAGYWDTESSGTTTGIGSGSGDVTGLTTSEMVGASAETNMPEFNFTGPWSTVTGPDGYPVLSWQDEANQPYFAVEITGSNSPVTEGETLNVTVEVENVGDATGTQTVELLYDNGTETVADGRTVDLSPDGTETFVLSRDISPGDFGTADTTVTSENDGDTATVEVQKDASFEVAVVSSDSIVADSLVSSLESGLTDAGVLGDYRLTQETPYDITGADASGAVNKYDRIVVNDFGGVGGIEGGSTPTVPDANVSELYNKIDADSNTRIVSLDMGSTFGTQTANAIARRADVLGDIDGVNTSSDGTTPVQMEITGDHHLFKDVGSVGDTVDVYTAPSPARDWFVGYTGESFAEIGESSGPETDGPAAGVTTGGNEVLLTLGGDVDLTPDGERILANAVVFPFGADISAQIDVVSDRDSETPVFVNGTVVNSGSETDNLTVTAEIVDETDGTTEATETVQVGETDDAGNRLTELETNSTELTFRFDSLTALNPDGPDYTANLTAQSDNASLVFDTDGFNVTGQSGETDCIDRRNLGRGEGDQECPRDRTLERGEKREGLDERTGRNSATPRRNRGR